MRRMLASLLAGICLASTCEARAWDYVAIRGTTITSERPISVLALEALTGVIHGFDRRPSICGISESKTTITNDEKRESSDGADAIAGRLDGVRVLESSLSIDGRPVARLGILPSLRRLAGFVLWDQAGRIERTTTATVRGRSVRITDAVTNGRVRVRVVIGPPLGDKRVKCAVLDLEVADDGRAFRRTAETRIRIACSAHIELPGDRCRLVRRIASRAAEREAGPELCGRIQRLEDSGRLAVKRGRAAIPAIVEEFIHTMTSQER